MVNRVDVHIKPSFCFHFGPFHEWFSDSRIMCSYSFKDSLVSSYFKVNEGFLFEGEALAYEEFCFKKY